MIHILKIKPLSVNRAYQGRRFATPELTKYKRDVGLLLPNLRVPTGQIEVNYTFGISKGTDGENCIKAFTDILAQKYGFNDNRIYRWIVEKVVVKKGEEFIEFQIKELMK